MPHFHATAEGNVPFTAEEEIAWAAEEAAQAANVENDRKAAIQATIDKLERDSMMNRGVRELTLRLMEKEALSQASGDQALATAILGRTPAYAKFKALDDQISALRAQL